MNQITDETLKALIEQLVEARVKVETQKIKNESGTIYAGVVKNALKLLSARVRRGGQTDTADWIDEIIRGVDMRNLGDVIRKLRKVRVIGNTEDV